MRVVLHEVTDDPSAPGVAVRPTLGNPHGDVVGCPTLEAVLDQAPCHPEGVDDLGRRPRMGLIVLPPRPFEGGPRRPRPPPGRSRVRRSGLSCQPPRGSHPLIPALDRHVVGCYRAPDTCRARHSATSAAPSRPGWSSRPVCRTRRLRACPTGSPGSSELWSIIVTAAVLQRESSWARRASRYGG